MELPDVLTSYLSGSIPCLLNFRSRDCWLVLSDPLPCGTIWRGLKQIVLQGLWLYHTQQWSSGQQRWGLKLSAPDTAALPSRQVLTALSTTTSLPAAPEKTQSPFAEASKRGREGSEQRQQHKDALYKDPPVKHWPHLQSHQMQACGRMSFEEFEAISILI